MKPAWPRTSLAELLRLERRPVRVQPEERYQEIGIYCFGRGVFHKPPRTGAEVGDKALFMMRAGDFILQVTFAWEGAVALLSAAEDGMYGSSRYPTFRVDDTRCIPEFLLYYFRTREGLDQLIRISPGSAGRNRVLSLKRIPEVSVPLPPLPQQRTLVAHLDALTARIQKASALQQEATEETDHIMPAEEVRMWPAGSLAEAAPLDAVTSYLARGRQAEQGESDHLLVKTQHVQQGRYIPTVLRLSPHAAARVQPEALLQDGDILIACSAAGCLGRVARYSGNGRPASTDTHVAVARPDPDVVHPDYLYAYLRGAQGQHQLRSRERGDWQREKVGFRLTELNLNDLRKVPVPLPSRDEQRRIVQELAQLQTKVDALKQVQAEIQTQLDALLPSILDKAFKGEL